MMRGSTMANRLKRPRDPVQLAKLIGDIATGQVEDAEPTAGKNPSAVAAGQLGGFERQNLYADGHSPFHSPGQRFQ
jgi:hypothetical protein